MKITECLCKTVLVRTGIYGMDYAINPYTGCEHSCIYCYAAFMKKYSLHDEPWGEFADVKINAPEVLEKQLKKIKEGSVLMSSVTDPYQPAEKKYEITRKCLEILSKTNLFTSILTKSPLVLRDIDILKKMNCNAGFTITTLNEEIRKKFEPKAPEACERLDALKKLSENNIQTYAFFGPIIPHFSDGREEINGIISACKEANVSYIIADRINLYPTAWDKIRTLLKTEYPELIPEYEQIIKNKTQYETKLRTLIREAAQKHKMKILECF